VRLTTSPPSYAECHEIWEPKTPGTTPALLRDSFTFTHFCWRLRQPQDHSAAGRIMSMKNSSDTIGNRTRDLPTCSSVPQPTTSPRTPFIGSPVSKFNACLVIGSDVKRPKALILDKQIL
jgi:hypothetical protein